MAQVKLILRESVHGLGDVGEVLLQPAVGKVQHRVAPRFVRLVPGRV